MRIAFFSNFLNHHQLPLCRALLACEGVDFTFVATEPIESERLNMGYADMNAEPFVLREYEKGGKDAAMDLAVSADVMIFGAAPVHYLQARMQEGKLTFYFTERVLKKGAWRRFIPTTRKKLKRQFLDHKARPLYVLAASAYMAADLKKMGFPDGRCLKWGYFPAVYQKDVDSLINLKGRKEKVQIMYAGRLMKLKRVIDALKAVKALVKGGTTNFVFSIIGEGEQKERLMRYVQKNGLVNYVEFKPFMPSDEVRTAMDGADVYFFGSDFREGWGAVVNEAMNSACAVVVSHAVGSAAHLIEHGKNGLIYECGNVKDLTHCFESVINCKEYRQSLGRRAYDTVVSEWSAERAASALTAVIDALASGEQAGKVCPSGVCAQSPVLKNGWIKGAKRR